MSKSDSRPRSVVMSDQLWNDLAVAAAQQTINDGKKISTAAFIRGALREKADEVIGTRVDTPAFPAVELPEIDDEDVDNTVPF